MTFPVFASGDVLNASDMNAVGLWLVKTQAVGSGVASVTVTGAFSADYDNYLVTYDGGTASTGTQLAMKLGSTATGYYGTLIYAQYSATTVLANVPDNNAVRWNYVGDAQTTWTHLAVRLSNPYKTTRTVFSCTYNAATVSGTTNGFLDNATSYTAFDIIAGTGTLTGGTIRVYGYRN
jgi:hypothetical protein